MKKSGWFEHTVGDAKKKGRARATVSICVKRGRVKDRHGRVKWDTWVYAYWRITPKRVDWVKKTYRKRFGIEPATADEPVRIRTTTTKFNVRFFYVAIGLQLTNLWCGCITWSRRAHGRGASGTTGIACGWSGCCSGWILRYLRR